MQPNQANISPKDALILAFDHYQKNRLPQAETLLRQILEVEPKNGGALHLLGVILFGQGNQSLAIELIRQATDIEPREPQFFSNLGEMCRRVGRIKEAIQFGQKAIALSPENATYQSNLGIAFYDDENLEAAEIHQRKATALDPTLLIALNNLGSIMRGLKKYPEATAFYRQVLKIDPHYHESANNLGSVLTEQDQPEEALKILLPLIASKPNYLEAFCNVGTAYLYLEKFKEAEDAFKKVLSINAKEFKGYTGMARILQERRELHEALKMAETALNLATKKGEIYSLLGSIYSELGFPEKSNHCFEEALKIDDKSITAYLGRGHLFLEKGDMKEAEQDFLKAAEIDPENMGARLAMVQAKKITLDDPSMKMLEAEALKLQKMPEIKAIPLHFALGKCHEDTQNYDEAFKHYKLGCDLKRARIQYDPNQNDFLGRAIKDLFTKEKIQKLRGDGYASNLPIFVLGMPRSGTTLTETILASHSKVYGAGELSDLMEIANETRMGIQGYPMNLQSITQAELKYMGERYVKSLRDRSTTAERITDKMPANFIYLGLIHLIMPHAKIIHVKRDPIDTCLSCYTKLFNKSQYQSYRLDEIGRYYRFYSDLMKHWKSVLPKDAFYEIQYENIVSDPEKEVRALLEYCNLPWEESCLNFHETKRIVKTASITQVRRPIYKSSVEKWRHFEKHLGPLIEALGDLVRL